MTRLLIAASGTGGHLFPALSVAQCLKDYEIEWLGVTNRLEQSLVPQEYPLHTLTVEGFQSKFSLATLKVILGQLKGIVQVKSLLKERNIDIVLTTGGYIAAPAILAAYWAGIPVILHESNSIPGKVTRLLSQFCSTIAIGFTQTASYLKRTTYVGTPVRDEFLTPQPLDLPISNSQFLIVVAGGSQGAVALNQLVRPCVAAWLKEGAVVVHLTGEKDTQADSHQMGYYSFPFYQNMAGLLQRANLAISRSGAGTLAELSVTETPSILVPFPFAAEDHQYYNARVFSDAGAAFLYRQSEIDCKQLEELVLKLLKDRPQLETMKQKTASLAVLDSAEQIAQIIRKLKRI